MPCAEFTNAINWSKKSSLSESFQVIAYFTKHFGGADNSKDLNQPKDVVHYASGPVVAIDKPTLHLKGTLRVAKNSDKLGEMLLDPNLTYEVEIFPDGTLSYLNLLKGKPVAGLPATKVQAACVNGSLLSASTGSEVVTVGVARLASQPVVT